MASKRLSITLNFQLEPMWNISSYHCTSIHWITAAADRITAFYMSIVIIRNLQLDARQMKPFE